MNTEYRNMYRYAGGVIQPTVAYLGILLGEGGSTNSIEDRQNGDLGAIAP